MGERTHTTTNKSNSGTKKTWTLVIAGTAVLLLAGGVMVQIIRPQSAFPDEQNPGGASAQQPGRATTGEQVKAKIVAKVGKDKITYDALAAECVARHGKEILDNLINRMIIQQSCDAQGIEISEAEVSKEIDKTAKKFNLAVDQWMSMLESERNVTAMQYRRDIVWPMLALRKLAGEDVKVSKADIDRAFVKNYGPRVRAKAIILNNARRAREVWEKAKSHPDEFEKLATDHSVEPNSRALGGVIPPIPRYSGSKDLEDVAFKMKEGEISPVVQVGLEQYVILKCEGRTTPQITKLTEDIQEILVQELKEEKVQEAVAKVFEKIKGEARVDNYVSGSTTGGERRPGGAKAGGGSAANSGAIRQTGGTASKRSGNQVPDDELLPTPSRSRNAGSRPAIDQ